MFISTYQIIMGLMRLVVIFAIFFVPIFCSGQKLGGELFHFAGTNRYAAGVKKDQFDFSQAKQEEDNWCWAASISMVLHYQGISVTQKAIVEKALGFSANRPASCDIMIRAANGWQKAGKTLSAFEENDLSPKNIIDILANKYPLVVGMNMPNQNVGHAYVLTAIHFTENKGTPDSVVLRDPWPTNEDRHVITWTDFIQRHNCIVHFTFN